MKTTLLLLILSCLFPSFIFASESFEALREIRDADSRASSAAGAISELEDQLEDTHFYQREEKKQIIEALGYAHLVEALSSLNKAKGFLNIILYQEAGYLHSERIRLFVGALRSGLTGLNSAYKNLQKAHPNGYKSTLGYLKIARKNLQTIIDGIDADNPHIKEPDIHNPLYNFLEKPAYNNHALADQYDPKVPHQEAQNLFTSIEQVCGNISDGFLETTEQRMKEPNPFRDEL